MRDCPEIYAGTIDTFKRIKYIIAPPVKNVNVSTLNKILDNLIKLSLSHMKVVGEETDNYLVCECGSGCFPGMNNEDDTNDWIEIIKNPDNRKCYHCSNIIPLDVSIMGLSGLQGKPLYPAYPSGCAE